VRKHSSKSPTAADFLKTLAERAASDSAYVAWAVREYAESQGESVDETVLGLGISAKDRDDFFVSIRPQGDRPADAVRAIVKRFGVDEIAFTSILRHVEVLTALRHGGAASADRGVLLAARMKDGDTSESGPADLAGEQSPAYREHATDFPRDDES